MNHIANHKKRIIPLFVLILILALIWFFWGKGAQTYSGVVEAAIISNISEVSGKIIEMPVELGQHVAKGDLIAKINDTDQKYAYEQLQLTLERKKLALSELQLGAGDTQADNSVSIAQSSYNSAASASQKASLDYKNALALYNQGAISKDTLELAKVKADSAAGAVTAAKAQLDNARSKASEAGAQLEVQQIESQLQEMKENLAKFSLYAVNDGVIMSKSYVLGDMVAPGYNLADIAADGEKYFVFYLPIDYVHFIDYDQIYKVSAEGTEYDAAVRYIDVESEFTPKDMQTTANKNKESIKIKLLLPEDCLLKPGQEAEIRFDFDH